MWAWGIVGRVAWQAEDQAIPWFYFSDRVDLIFAGIGLVLGLLMVLWWREQSPAWYAVWALSLLAGTLLALGSAYLFQIPPRLVGCVDSLCPGQIGYPLPFGQIPPDGGAPQIFLGDFLLNMELLWLAVLGTSVAWRFLALAVDLPRQSLRGKILYLLLAVLLPWALLPRFLPPPEPTLQGEALRVAVNARRAGEVTYQITGLWVQRLAFEDVRWIPVQVPAALRGLDQPQPQVCLRGYTYFYIPWRRYRITLDRTGTTPLRLEELPLAGSCWAY